LDPRESIAWSRDGGRTYVWGRAVGSYRGRGFDAIKIPFYGWQVAPGGPTGSNQPYSAYHTRAVGRTTVFLNAKRPLELVKAGGFTAGGDVGRVTVTNLQTGVSADALPPPGRGLCVGTLTQPVPVGVGQDYAVRASGEVEVLEADRQQRQLFPELGNPVGKFPYLSDGGNVPQDVAQVFAVSSDVATPEPPPNPFQLLFGPPPPPKRCGPAGI
jgi:hypothetical protein